MAIKKKKKKAQKKQIKRRAAKPRIIKKKPARKAPPKKKKPAAKKSKENIIGKITHYFPHVRAGVIKLKGVLAAGDNIKIKGHTTEFTQVVDSMQIDHVPVSSAGKGQEIGLLVASRVRRGDTVYKL